MTLVLLLASMNAGAQVRMLPIPADRMTEAQQKAVAEYEAARGSNPSGPWMVLLRVPDVMSLAFKWRQHLQFGSVLDQRLTEFAILIAARSWTQQFEWNAHHPLALKAGLDAKIIQAVAEGRRPERMAEDEEILYDFCVELERNKSVSDATYARALSKFGEAGIIEAATIEGYYALLAMAMNVARTPLPEGTKPPLAPLPR